MPPIFSNTVTAPKPLTRAAMSTGLSKMKKNKYRIPVLEVLADMAPGHGMPMSTLAPMVADVAGTRQQNMAYFSSNLLQTCIGYIDRSKSNRYEPTLIGAGFVAADELDIGDGVSETVYFITPAGRVALDGFLAASQDQD